MQFTDVSGRGGTVIGGECTHTGAVTPANVAAALEAAGWSPGRDHGAAGFTVQWAGPVAVRVGYVHALTGRPVLGRMAGDLRRAGWVVAAVPAGTRPAEALIVISTGGAQ